MQSLSLKNRLALAMGIAFLLGFSGFALHLSDIRDELRTMMLSSLIGGASTLPDGTFQLICDRHGQPLQTHGTLSPPADLSAISCATEARLLTNDQYAVLQTVTADGGKIITLRDDSHEQQLIDDLINKRLWRGMTLWVLLSVISLLIIALLIRWTLRPVRSAAQLAESIGPEHSTPRIEVQNLPVEIRPLALAINGMLDRLIQASMAQSRFVADTSHALRTPLTALCLRLQHYRHALPDADAIEEELRDLRQLVDQLLMLARCDMLTVGEHRGQQAPAKISRLARQTAATLLPLVEGANRRLEADIADGIEAKIDELAFSELLKIGVDNALLHGRGNISLIVTTWNNLLLVQIADQGSGPPYAARSRVFERFCKLSPATRGCGLGLSVAKEIVRRYAGEIQFLDTATCTLFISLPIVAQEENSAS